MGFKEEKIFSSASLVALATTAELNAGSDEATTLIRTHALHPSYGPVRSTNQSDTLAPFA